MATPTPPIRSLYADLFRHVTNPNIPALASLVGKLPAVDLKVKRQEDGLDPISLAASLGHFDVLQFLASLKNASVDFNSRDSGGRTALYHASENGYIQIAEFLLANGSDPRFGNKDDTTPLLVAAYSGNAEIVAAILDSGLISLNVADNSGKTALHLAAFTGHTLIVTKLVQRGAELNVTDKFGWTPLMLAAHEGHIEVVRALVERNADVHVVARDGRSAESMAQDKRYSQILSVLQGTYHGGISPLPTPAQGLHAQSSAIGGQTNGLHQRHGRSGFGQTGTGGRTRHTLTRPVAGPSPSPSFPSRGPGDRPPVNHETALGTPGAPQSIFAQFANVITFLIPKFCFAKCGKDTDDKVSAWKEKYALCVIIFFISAALGFFTFGFSQIACIPEESILRTELRERYGQDPKDAGVRLMAVHGVLYNVAQFVDTEAHNLLVTGLGDGERNSLVERIQNDQGTDISYLFANPNPPSTSCPHTPSSGCPRNVNSSSLNFCHDSSSALDTLKGLDAIGRLIYKWDDITPEASLFVYNSDVYILEEYFSDDGDQFLPDNVNNKLRDLLGKDATKAILRDSELSDIVPCLEMYFKVGSVSSETTGCQFTSLIQIVSLTVLILIILIKFLSAMFFTFILAPRMTGNPMAPSAKDKEKKKPNIIVLVTAYSEGESGMRTTLDSIVRSTYEGNVMVLAVADGIVKGKGEEMSTPDILKSLVHPKPIRKQEARASIQQTDNDILSAVKGKVTEGRRKSAPTYVSGCIDDVDGPAPHSYMSIGAGPLTHNQAYVVAGHYHTSPTLSPPGSVPLMVINKTGNPSETSSAKPGNRGKRDSQLVLMQFLSKVVFNERMTPLEFEMAVKAWDLTGFSPDQFDLVLMVDADTLVLPSSLSYMAAAMTRDSMIMGLTGETLIMNKSASWIASIQVFEYRISHHLAKAFESIFGGVTCLPGCFCMYRVKAPGRGGNYVPILANPDIIEDYSSTNTKTLHRKNLLLLGEDRFLSTLMIKTFPARKMCYVPQAQCKTLVPDSFKVLLSQRRRWINSTVHNLLELVFVPQLCGIFCCSMQFVVGLELIGTIVMPASFAFLIYLIIAAIAGVGGLAVPLIFMGSVFLLQGILVMFTSGKIDQAKWLGCYLSGLAVWNFILPLYAFWHFDDFSWGDTRKTSGGGSKSLSEPSDIAGKSFEASQIPLKRFHEWVADRQKKIVRKRDMSQNLLMTNGLDLTNGGNALGVIEDASYQQDPYPQVYQEAYVQDQPYQEPNSGMVYPPYPPY